MALRMAVKARIILLQPHRAMRHFRNLGTISLSDILFKLLKISYSKNLVSRYRVSTLSTESENIYTFTYQVIKQ
jgi:hypothetical protein